MKREVSMNKEVMKVVKLDQKYNLGLCHGLAPNPFGFTFDSSGLSSAVIKEVSKLLTSIDLSQEKTKELIKYM